MTSSPCLSLSSAHPGILHRRNIIRELRLLTYSDSQPSVIQRWQFVGHINVIQTVKGETRGKLAKITLHCNQFMSFSLLQLVIAWISLFTIWITLFIMALPNVMWREAHCFCLVRSCVCASVCASQNIVNTILYRVFECVRGYFTVTNYTNYLLTYLTHFSPNLNQRCFMGQR